MTDQAEAGSVADVVLPAGNLEKPTEGAENRSAAPEVKSWFDGLSEGNRKIAEAKGWTKPDGSIDKVLTSYAELERQQGESLRVPAPDAPKEDWEKFHSKLPEDMRPVTSPDKLEFKRPDGLPENLPYSDELATAAKAWAVDAGASPKVAQAYHDKYVGYMADQAKAAQAALTKSVEDTHTDLVKDWGPTDSEGFKAKLAVTNRGLSKLGLADAFKAKGILLPDGTLTDPQIARAFNAIGDAMFKDDTIDDSGAGKGGENPFKRNAAGERNMSAISALVKSDPQRARQMATAAGENPDLWISSHPL